MPLGEAVETENSSLKTKPRPLRGRGSGAWRSHALFCFARAQTTFTATGRQ